MSEQQTEALNWLDQLADEHTDEAAKAEANRRDTIKQGRYRMKVVKAKADVAGDKTQTPGRKILRLTADVQVAEDKTAKLFFDISPEAYKTAIDQDGKRVKVARGHELFSPAAKYDSQYKNWAELEGLVVPKGEKATLGQVVAGLDGLEFSAYVSESFIDPDGNFVKAENDEERDNFIAEGWESKNFVMQIRR